MKVSPRDFYPVPETFRRREKRRGLSAPACTARSVTDVSSVLYSRVCATCTIAFLFSPLNRTSRTSRSFLNTFVFNTNETLFRFLNTKSATCTARSCKEQRSGDATRECAKQRSTLSTQRARTSGGETALSGYRRSSFGLFFGRATQNSSQPNADDIDSSRVSANRFDERTYVCTHFYVLIEFERDSSIDSFVRDINIVK